MAGATGLRGATARVAAAHVRAVMPVSEWRPACTCGSMQEMRNDPEMADFWADVEKGGMQVGCRCSSSNKHVVHVT